MSQQELLTRVIRTLEALELEYMLTGSLASSLHGEPRLTHDIDMVVALKTEAIPRLPGAFPPPEFYLSEQSIHEAIRTESMFMLLHTVEGDKIDFWILTDSPFDQSRLQRRVCERIDGLEVAVSSPEDTILAKLRWAKLSGGSAKHLGDARSVYEVQYDILDLDYLETWADRLEIRPLWEELKRSAEIE